MRRLFAYLATAALFVLGLMFSALLFALIALAGLCAWGYLWWKSRALRRQMRGQVFCDDADACRVTGGDVIEGEVIRRIVTTETTER